MSKIIEHSALVCPECHYEQILKMPSDACLWFHPCSNCDVLLTPKEGDCCVFCSYGSIPCPPIQLQHSGEKSTGCCNGN